MKMPGFWDFSDEVEKGLNEGVETQFIVDVIDIFFGAAVSVVDGQIDLPIIKFFGELELDCWKVVWPIEKDLVDLEVRLSFLQIQVDFLDNGFYVVVLLTLKGHQDKIHIWVGKPKCSSERSHHIKLQAVGVGNLGQFLDKGLYFHPGLLDVEMAKFLVFLHFLRYFFVWYIENI